MTEPKRSTPAKTGPAPARRARIETQIHRRRNVKASPPLEDEWDPQHGQAPEGLRTPQDKMKR